MEIGNTTKDIAKEFDPPLQVPVDGDVQRRKLPKIPESDTIDKEAAYPIKVALENDVGKRELPKTPELPKEPESVSDKELDTTPEAAAKGDVEKQEVTWDGPDDVTNPKNWSYRRKWTITILVSTYTLISSISTSIVAPALATMGTDLHIHSSFEQSLTLSVFVLAYAFGPFVIGPLSEVYGRVVVLQLANLWYLVFNIACGSATSKDQMIAFRFLAGIGGSAPFTIGGGVLGDMWRADERGKSIGIYTLAPLLGPVLGPIVGGFITEHTTWRWVFWTPSIADCVVQVLGILFLKETFAPKILGDKAQRLRKSTGSQALHTMWDASDRTLLPILQTALKRPFILLATQPIIQVLALYLAYLYGVVYIVLTTFPTLWTDRYHQPIGIAGLNYISLGVGFIIGTQSTARLQDTIYKRLKTRSSKSVGQPEYRLPLLLPASILVPAGLFWYGWSAQAKLHWVMPNIGIALFGMGMKIGTQCAQSYAVDAYTLYAASAGAAGTFLRSLCGFGFPLFAPYMYTTMGYGWGNSMLACIALILGGSAPLLLWKYGPYLRARSTYAAGGGD